eukprot:TRINITY_DN22279_c0_g1_i1.p1 TRINITY_DN22279_c0_g1~~TRINITY_DN22279_c0_g1_i1.p1  ORF type:complete len:232 (+),score=5.44 TRINITY_DN22279_c0_g1_i1:99-794(+)
MCIRDRHQALAPIAANLRGESNIIESTGVLAFKAVEYCKRRSHQKVQVDMTTVQKRLFQNQRTFLEKSVMPTEVENFYIFLTNLTSLIRSRGLTIHVLSGLYQDQNSTISFDDVGLKRFLDSSFGSSKLGWNTLDTLGLMDGHLESLNLGDKLFHKWLKKLTTLFRQFPILIPEQTLSPTAFKEALNEARHTDRIFKQKFDGESLACLLRIRWLSSFFSLQNSIMGMLVTE